MPTSLCSYSTGRHVALLEHIIMINANQYMLLLRVDMSLYSNTSSWLMSMLLLHVDTLLEHIMMINANQSMLLLHG